MQCPNCRFENMPGVIACGRCGGSLGLATATIDVQPPRAGKWSKRLRNMSFKRQSFQIRDALTSNVARLGGDYYDSVPESPLLMRLVVPGWAQMYCGRRMLGQFLLATYIVFLVIAIPFIGTQFGSIMLGLAIACHASSIIDIVNASPADLRHRAIVFLSCIVIVMLVVYVPFGWTLSSLAVPRVIALESPPFKAGDTVLYMPAATGLVSLRPGKIVIYRIPDITISEGHIQRQVGGERIDRILAGPGQHVRWHNRQLEIDGQPSTLGPANPAFSPQEFEITVPASHFMIFPSNLGVSTVGLNQRDLHRLNLINSSAILGIVFWKQQPISQCGWVR